MNVVFRRCLQNQVDIESDLSDSKIDLDKPPPHSVNACHKLERYSNLANHIILSIVA